MEKLTLEVPAMYGDHHVTEVRRLLFALSGIKDVYASSAFQTVEVTYDPTEQSDEVIIATLDRAGYLGPLEMPLEETAAAGRKANGRRLHFRHTASYAQTGRSISFTRIAPYLGRPLWPCPGFGPMNTQSGDDESGE